MGILLDHQLIGIMQRGITGDKKIGLVEMAVQRENFLEVRDLQIIADRLPSYSAKDNQRRHPREKTPTTWPIESRIGRWERDFSSIRARTL
jgi:hypothetical protein